MVKQTYTTLGISSQVSLSALISKTNYFRFEEGAKTFMIETLRLSRKLRPEAKWGYYHYPYCFSAKTEPKCPKQILDENDRFTGNNLF